MKSRTIDVVSDISQQEFNGRYFFPQKPLVIKGLADHYPAGKKWTMDYIKQVCGEVMVDVYDNNNRNSASAYTDPDLKMKFSQYAETLTSEQPTSLRMFLFNMFKSRPELRKDFPCPDIFKGLMGKIGFMFFGAKGITVRIHQDMDMSNVMLTQFHGRKRVVLVAPQYSRLLYKLPFNTHSLVDLDKPDYDKYPGLKYIEIYECILEPGDSLYMPSGYWHYITYLDGGFSVSYRKMAHSLKAKWEGFLSLCIYMPFDKLMNRILGSHRWLPMKEKIARERAEKEIKRFGGGSEQSVGVQFQTH